MDDELTEEIEHQCGEIRANGGVKPAWMQRIEDSTLRELRDANTPGRNENSIPD